MNEADKQSEIDRRLKLLDDLQSKFQDYTSTIFNSSIKALTLIKKIEKSTVVSEKTRQASRYLFYLLTDQSELMQAANGVLTSFHVVPPLDAKPNITAETFLATKKMISLINNKNSLIAGYFDDLEVILHNDLVKGIYGKAKYETIPTNHLSAKGLTDSRVKVPLL